MQSSSERIPLDRSDAINSSVKGERDFGMYFMWTGQKRKDIMHEINDKGLKHSGDFGVFAFGFYNGQAANNTDKNKMIELMKYCKWKTNAWQLEIIVEYLSKREPLKRE